MDGRRRDRHGIVIGLAKLNRDPAIKSPNKAAMAALHLSEIWVV